MQMSLQEGISLADFSCPHRGKVQRMLSKGNTTTLLWAVSFVGHESTQGAEKVSKCELKCDYTDGNSASRALQINRGVCMRYYEYMKDYIALQNSSSAN